MGDMMLLGVLRMRMDNPTPLQLAQFIARARQAADRIEADAKEIERLRLALLNVRAHTGHTKLAPDQLHIDLLARIGEIVDTALAGKESK